MKSLVLAALLCVAPHVIGASEAQARGWAPISSHQASEIVADAHFAFFSQAPTRDDSWYWEQRLLDGSYPVVTDELSDYISSSFELEQNVRQHGSRHVIANVYRTLFNRRAGPQDFAAWQGYLDRGNYHAFVFGVLASVEFQRSYGMYLID